MKMLVELFGGKKLSKWQKRKILPNIGRLTVRRMVRFSTRECLMLTSATKIARLYTTQKKNLKRQRITV